MRFLEEHSDSADGAQNPSLELSRYREYGFLERMQESPRDGDRSLEIAPQVEQSEKLKKSNGFYFGQFAAVGGLWTGTALLPWLSGQPALALGDFPLGVYATVALPVSVYFALVVNPRVPIVLAPYGFVHTARSGRRTVVRVDGGGFREMTPEEREELELHNAVIDRRHRRQLELRRFERRERRLRRRIERKLKS